MACIHRREFVARMSAVIAAATAGPAPAQRSGQPNLLFVFADQMRFCDLGVAGNEYIRTPNLDRLASQGALLTNAFASAPVCSPYRAQLLTGKYSHRNGVTSNDIHMPEGQHTIGAVLKREGYATGYIGKWHLDGGRRAPANDPRSKGYVPMGAPRHGFDFWAALECSHRYYKTHYFRDTPDPIPIETYEPDVQTDIAIEFLKQNRSRPFSLFLSWGPPHDPYPPPDKYRTYDPAKIPLRPNVPKEHHDDARRTLAMYYGLIASLDDNIGRLTAALDSLGLAQNTIVCFTSDHGDMHRSQGHLLKQKPWEESAHVPFIVRYPRGVRAGRQAGFLFNSVDIMPTLLSMCGAPVPAAVQGADLSGLMLGKQAREPESLYLALNSVPLGPRGTGAGGPWRGVRTEDWMYCAREGRDWLMYDMKRDPYQLNNLAEDRTASAQRQRLRALTDDWMKRTGDQWPAA